jgi:hypothetical protein
LISRRYLRNDCQVFHQTRYAVSFNSI